MDRGGGRSGIVAATGLGRRGAWRGGRRACARRRASRNWRRRRHRRLIGRIRCGVRGGRRRIISRRQRIVAPRAGDQRSPASATILVLAVVLLLTMLVLAVLALVFVVIDKQCPARLRDCRHAQALGQRSAANPDPDRHSSGQRCPDHLCRLSQSSGTERDNAPPRHLFACPEWDRYRGMAGMRRFLEPVAQPLVPAIGSCADCVKENGQHAIFGCYRLRRDRGSSESGALSRTSR